jgi:hypothetical protein
MKTSPSSILTLLLVKFTSAKLIALTAALIPEPFERTVLREAKEEIEKKVKDVHDALLAKQVDWEKEGKVEDHVYLHERKEEVKKLKEQLVTSEEAIHAWDELHFGAKGKKNGEMFDERKGIEGEK